MNAARIGGEEIRAKMREEGIKEISRAALRYRFKQTYKLWDELRSAHVYLFRRFAVWVIERYGLRDDWS